jgi:mannose-6-phosphate isomerase
MLDPIRLTPKRFDKVWGKTRLAPWHPDSKTAIGEIWYLADRELPILVKMLFTAEDLSVQVHPADGDDGPNGKTEMWYILEAEPGASVAVGFREPITRERLRESALTGEIERLQSRFSVRPGDVVFTPARTVHAIGAGLVLFEIQQNSDITYRLWDYGRNRPMQVEQGAAIADPGVHPGATAPKPLAPGREELARCPYFVTELARMRQGESVTPPARRCQQWIGVEGRATIAGRPFAPGEVWLLPEEGPQPEIRAEADSRFLIAYLP